jgi:hypothetical protein
MGWTEWSLVEDAKGTLRVPAILVAPAGAGG